MIEENKEQKVKHARGAEIAPQYLEPCSARQPALSARRSVSRVFGARLARLTSLFVGLAIMLPAANVRAQESEKGLGGISLLLAVPLGEFADFVDASPGGNLFGVYNVDRGGMFGLRFDASVVLYGHESERRPLSRTIQRVQVDVSTDNTIFSLLLGPQLTITGGAVRPYLNAGVGFSYFNTTSSVSGTTELDQDFASSTNFDDITFAWAGGGGIWIRLSRKVSLDLSGRYLGNGEVRYLREGSIMESPSGSVSFTPIESETNMLLLQVGVSIGVGIEDEG